MHTIFDFILIFHIAKFQPVALIVNSESLELRNKIISIYLGWLYPINLAAS